MSVRRGESKSSGRAPTVGGCKVVHRVFSLKRGCNPRSRNSLSTLGNSPSPRRYRTLPASAAERVPQANAGVGSGSGIPAEMEPTVRVARSIHVVGRVAEPDMTINLGTTTDIELDDDDPMVRLAVNGA